MSIFSRSKNVGGIMDVIRCDEPSYLVWKWHPAGTILGDNKRENAIRWGSSLRVKDGEAAVFVYNQPNGIIQDFIVGPFDETIKTENLPVLSNVLGLIYNGDSPFQAEIYFINLAKIIQIPLAVSYFDIFDPRFPDFGVPTAVRGQISFNIADCQEFVKLHRLINFDLNDFQNQIKDATARYVKDTVINIVSSEKVPVVQIESKLYEINEIVQNSIRERFIRDFGVNVTAIDISAIDIDKTSDGYNRLRMITQDLTMSTARAQTEVNIKDLHDMQRINAENTEESLRIQREEAQYLQRKQTQSAHMEAYKLEQQGAVGIAGANALGQMGSNGASEMSSGGMNPAGMMAGMVMGGTIANNMAGMMNGIMKGLDSQQQNASGMPGLGTNPPPIPCDQYYVVLNGQSTGPYNKDLLAQLVSTGTVTKDSLIWKQGMEAWEKAEFVKEMAVFFETTKESMIQSNSDVPAIPKI